jgi:hypothetical protein
LKATDESGSFTKADLDVLKKTNLVTMEKWQGTDATDPATKERVFIWEEDAWVAAARAIKQVNPNASVVVWMDTTLIYTGWRLDGNTGVINHTLNPDANQYCATGHFRPAEFLERYPQLLVHNSSDQPVISKYGQCHVYDHTQPRVRQYWRDQCLKMTQSGAIDGCGADFSSGQHNSMARNTVAVCVCSLCFRTRPSPHFTMPSCNTHPLRTPWTSWQ